MTAKQWKIIDEEFISYTGGTAQLITNGECKVHLWETPKDAQLFCDKLNAINEENEQLKHRLAISEKAKYVTTLEKENERLKSQLYYDDEEGVCNICKHHYLIKDDEAELGYYNSRCKKGHYECARVSLKHCEDFEKELVE